MWKKISDYMDSYGFEFEHKNKEGIIFEIKITNKTLTIISVVLILALVGGIIKEGVCN